jgi:hypothetical protein
MVALPRNCCAEPEVLGNDKKLQPNLPSCNRFERIGFGMVCGELSAPKEGEDESPQHAPAQVLLAG